MKTEQELIQIINDIGTNMKRITDKYVDKREEVSEPDKIQLYIHIGTAIGISTSLGEEKAFCQQLVDITKKYSFMNRFKFWENN